MSLSPSAEARYWAKVDRKRDDECWPWLAGTNSDNHGVLWLDGRNVYAHQVAWLLATGSWPTRGLKLYHDCGLATCCNPRHLRLDRDWRRVPSGEGTKHCTRCERERPLTDFATGNAPDGRAYWCRECRRQSMAAWRQRNAEKVQAQNVLRRGERREGECAVCGEPFSTSQPQRRYCGDLCQARASEARHGKHHRHKRRAAKRTLTDLTSADVRALMSARTFCPLCRHKMTVKSGPRQRQLDHIIPLCVGGTHTHANVRVICRTCNLTRPKDGSDVVGPVALWAVAV